MIIAVQPGRAEKLADLETKSALARDVAPALAISIIAQRATMLHTEKLLTSWGQVPAERSSSIVARTLSNWIHTLGGAIRVVELFSKDDKAPTLLSAVDKDKYLEHVAQTIANGVSEELTGKVNVGISSRIGFVGRQDLGHLLKMVKKTLRKKEISARVVLAGKGGELNAAAIKYNNLTTKGYEFVLWPVGGRREEGASKWQSYLAMTLASYDPDRDTKLDRGIPVSKPELGMLPPKLARMMVNIALGQALSAASVDPAASATSSAGLTVVDPFCGTGRVLLEALLLGNPVLGNDLDRAQIDGTKRNIHWLGEQPDLIKELPNFELSVTDARSFRGPKKPHVMVTEPWLGPALRSKPSSREARLYADQVINIVRAGLKSWLVNKPASLVMALPRWRTSDRQEIAVVDNIQEELRKQGYRFEFIETVARADSLVARDIILALPN